MTRRTSESCVVPVLLVSLLLAAGCAGTATSGSSQAPNTPSAAGQLTASIPAVSFGQTSVGANATQNVTLSASGSSSVTVKSIQVSGTGFTIAPPALPATLASGQTMVLAVQFSPPSPGQQNGSLVVGSNAATPQLTVPLSGTGTAASANHSATVSWDNGDPTAISYTVYRSGVSGGPYAPLNASPLSVTTYTDSSVSAGSTYFYVVTESNAAGVESQFSSEVSATVPTS
jgi:hypothetical protein